jgi:hypothetical protein
LETTQWTSVVSTTSIIVPSKVLLVNIGDVFS